MHAEHQCRTLLWIAAGAVILGSFLPWATAGIVSVNGTNGDGVLTLILGACAALAAFRYHTVAAALLAAAGVVGVYDAAKVADVGAGIGVGLWLVIAGAILGVAARVRRATTTNPVA
jgi:hypothetical protein